MDVWQNILTFFEGLIYSLREVYVFLTQPISIGSQTFTIMGALSVALPSFLFLTISLHIVHLVNPLG